jgi:II/X family phage/plasmid replication protein
MIQDSFFPDYKSYPIPIDQLIKMGTHHICSPEAIAHDVGNSRILQFPDKQLIIALDLKNHDKEGQVFYNNFLFGEFYLSRQPDTFQSQMTSTMSFDTVKFGVPFSPSEFESFKETFLPYQSFVRNTNTGEIESTNDKFQLVTPDDMDKLTSDTKTVTFYYSDSNYVIFEMSIPKQMYGHNSLMFWQLDTFFHRFRNYLINQLGFDVEHWENWILKRVDVCYNYYLNSLEEVENTLDYLSDLRMRNRACIRNSSGKNIAYWAFQTRTIKFYSKYNEMLVHKKSFDPKTYDDVLESSRNILRFEEEWRAKYLLSKLNLKKVNEITVGKFLNYVIKEYNRSEHIITLLGEAVMVDRKFSLKETMDTIKQNFKKPTVYNEFIISIIDKGLDFTKKSMPKASYYANVKALKTVGIDVSVINERFHHKLEANENKPRMDFSKAPISNITDEEAMFIQHSLYPEPKGKSISLKEFLADTQVRFTTIDGWNSSMPEGYQIRLIKEAV